MNFKTILVVMCLLSVLFSQAQVTNAGHPKSWKLDLKPQKTFVMPSFSLKALQKEDSINDAQKNQPFRFGYEHLVSLGLDHGVWNELENGDKVWLLNIKSKGAKTLNFLFDEFHIPEGAKLYFYNDDRTDVLGAYTASQNREDMQFGTWLINGDNIWIEYFEPANADFEGQLHISKVVHGYRSVKDITELSKSLNSSGSCNQDVNCPIGFDFEAKKNELKKSVAMIIVGTSGFCSGALINNTNNDGSQYFLTANHCLVSSTSNWAFRFNWISPDPSCSTTVESTNGDFNQTISGATLLANNSKSDFALLEIDAPFPNDWDLVWAGWDRSGDIPDFTVGIHHPNGDIMKVSRDNDSPSKNTIAFEGERNMENWLLDQWEIGVTEQGSSGSPLFDQNGRIIGQLAGGAAACDGTNNNGAFDYYGRFDVSWDFGNSANSRLQDWLDPGLTDILVLNQFPPKQVFTNDVAILVDKIKNPVCGDEVIPTFRILNQGSENVTNASLTYQLGSEPQNFIQWSGNLATGESDIIASPVLDITQSNTLQVSLEINGAEDKFKENNTFTQVINNLQNERFATDFVKLTLTTDDFASETTWEFYNSDENLIAKNEEPLADNTTYTEVFEVNPDSCYELKIFDSAGDGLCCEFGNGYFKIETDSEEIITEGAEFSYVDITNFRVNERKKLSENNFSIFPNPATTFISVLSNSEVEFEAKLFDIRGRLVYTKRASDNLNINLISFSSGIYFVKLNNGIQSVTKKIVKQ